MKYLTIAIVSAIIGLGGASAAQSPLNTAARSGVRVRIPAQCFGVTMHLQPGAQRPPGYPSHGWIGNSWEIARDIPLDAVTAEAPLYPSGVPSHARLANNIFMGVLGSSYIKTAAAEFSLPTGVEPALRWYRKSFAACGFTPGESSTAGVGFVSPTTPTLDIDVSLQAVSSHSSLVLYYASALSHPGRPSNSFIPDVLGGTASGLKGSISSATVTYRAANSKSVRVTLANPLVIFNLVSIVDEPPAVAVDFACVTRQSESAVVVFHAANGRAYRLVVDPSCSFAVSGSRLIDDENRGVWSYIGYLVYKHCFQYGCPSLR